ncbi:hypothetical protein BJ138DRAFT_1106399 [Hygrophoropsis aurantiaca]|uniref:Uncharacterized protein n=1 Tax=Hygrophoropsis aurantiaca TaxID=72124 RepID=A0ACB7ZVJ8_9AGAM|nr:hypothetical protein BJ138DRAFT_1106399 [Hygrophoropsis aurantiaca]
MPQLLFRSASLNDLVDDVLIQVLQTSSPQTILSLRKTSRRYYFLTKVWCIWYEKFRTEVLARNLPIPGPSHSISLLRAAELEYRTLRAIYLQRRWPRLRAHAYTANTTNRELVDQVILIRGGTQILTVHMNKLACWAIDDRNPMDDMPSRLTQVAEWSSPSEEKCKVSKESKGLDIIVVGPKHQALIRGRANGYAMVLALGPKPYFRSLCEYSRVPGVIAGITDNLLFVDTTAEPGGGGLELLDWRAQTTGTVLLPCIADLFGGFVGYELFSGHIIVVWETAISVFPIPTVPEYGQVVIEHIRVFMLHEVITRPVAFSTCVARALSDTIFPTSQQAPLSLTIAARPMTKSARVSMSMLIPHASDDLNDRCPFPYSLARLSPFVPGVTGDQERGYVGQTCTDICLGPSGRGLCVVGQEVRLCTPSLLIMPPCEMQFGPAFETGEPIYELEGSGESGESVDFDEGMGRFAIAKASGGFEVVQLV